MNTPPCSPSQTHPHHEQSAQYLTIEMLAAALKIVQATQATQAPPPPPPPPPPPTSSGIEEIPEARGSKVEVKVLDEMYARETPNTYLEIR